MAVKDWVCSVCSAQNRNADSVCRVCDTPRKQAEAAETVSEPVKKAKSPRRERTPKPPRRRKERKSASIGPAAPARRSRALRVMNILWYVVLALTAVQWLLNMPLPDIFQDPQASLYYIRRFTPAGYVSALGQGVSELAAQIGAAQALTGPMALWDYGLNVLSDAFSSPLAAQCTVLTAVWLVRLIVLALAETKESAAPRQRNISYFTIIPIDLLLTAMALVPRMSGYRMFIRMQLMPLVSLQLLAIGAALAAFLLIGALSRRRMTRCLVKGCVSAVLIWLCGALIWVA